MGPYDLALEKRAQGARSAMLREAPHPHAARLFMNFFYSPEFSEVYKRSWIFPLHSGVAAADGRKPSSFKHYRSSADRLVTGIPEVVAKRRETFGV